MPHEGQAICLRLKRVYFAPRSYHSRMMMSIFAYFPQAGYYYTLLSGRFITSGRAEEISISIDRAVPPRLATPTGAIFFHILAEYMRDDDLKARRIIYVIFPFFSPCRCHLPRNAIRHCRCFLGASASIRARGFLRARLVWPPRRLSTAHFPCLIIERLSAAHRQGQRSRADQTPQLIRFVDLRRRRCATREE